MDSLNVLQADYYDTYDYRNYLSGFVSSLNYIADENYGKLYEDNSEVPLHCKGLLTGSMTTTLGVDRKLYGCYYYDYNRNLIQERHTILNGEIALYRYSYDFNGQPVKSAESYGSGIEFKRVYSYDHVGRLLEERHILKNDTTRFVYDYDALGCVKSLVRIHDKDSLSTENEYNIRNWLTAIRNPHFTQELHYTDGIGMPCYNGNISSMNWMDSNSSGLSGYKFTYDGLNRMTDALYGEGSNLAVNSGRFNEQVTGYDKMGNIIGLKRSGQLSSDNYGWIDNLTIHYDGNQLKKVVDDAAGSINGDSFDFKDESNEEIEYVYDSNGNLIKDFNKKIADIQYNILNLPCRIVFEDGNSISYLYDANGLKLRALHIMGNDTVTTDYCGNVIYENGVAKTLLTGYGYISLNDNKYHYFIQDHQGNNRVIVDQEGKVEEVNHYYPFGGLMAQSTGSVQTYKYNGKEFEVKGGLNLYDYGARHYDPALGRFITVDPMAEKYYSVSPYNYCGNEPIGRIDPDGADWRVQTHYNEETGKIEYYVTVNAVLYNNSNMRNVDMQELATNITEQINSTYSINDNDFVSKMDFNLRVVNSIDEINESDHILQIVNQRDFRSTGSRGNKVAADSYPSGLGIRLGTDLIVEMQQGRNGRTVAHELGHTGGLGHQNTDPRDKNNLMMQAYFVHEYEGDYNKATKLNHDQIKKIRDNYIHNRLHKGSPLGRNWWGKKQLR